MSNYDLDYDIPRSPGLEEFRPKSTPEPEKLPFQPRSLRDMITLSPQVKRDKKWASRRRTQPTRCDTVLLNYMGPNMPDVANRASLVALNSASHSEVSDSEMEDDAPPATKPSDTAKRRSKPLSNQSRHRSDAASSTTPPPSSLQPAQSDLTTAALRATQLLNGSGSYVRPGRRASGGYVDDEDMRDGDLAAASTPDRAAAASAATAAASAANKAQTVTSPDVASLRISALDMDHRSEAHTPNPIQVASSTATVAPSIDLAQPLLQPLQPPPRSVPEDSLATSPNLRAHTIPESKGPPEQKLPAIYALDSPSNDGPGSPNHGPLPAIGHIKELADTAAAAAATINVFHQHCQPLSAAGIGRSPPFSGLSVGNHMSPMAAATPRSDISPLDQYAKSPFASHLPCTPVALYHRTLQSSDTSPGRKQFAGSQQQQSGSNRPSPESIKAGIGPATSAAAGAPCEGPSPRPFQQACFDLNTRLLPLPVPQVRTVMQHVPSHGTGSFKCEVSIVEGSR